MNDHCEQLITPEPNGILTAKVEHFNTFVSLERHSQECSDEDFK